MNSNTFLFVTIANLHVQDWTDSCLASNHSSHTGRLFICEAACTLGVGVASVVLPLFQEYRSTVRVQQASNPHQNTIWITSGLPAIARIFARILAVGFTPAVHWWIFLPSRGR